MFIRKVGSCLSTSVVFDQQNIHCKTLTRIPRVEKLQRIILKSKCAVSEREILLKIEKNKRVECADQKRVNIMTFDHPHTYNFNLRHPHMSYECHGFNLHDTI